MTIASDVTEKELRERQAAFKASTKGKPCAVCGSRLFVQAHHVVYRQVIRSVAQTMGVDPAELEWDTRDALPVCKLCHGRHHSGAGSIPRPLLVIHAPQALQFARELGETAVAHIKRAYPLSTTKGDKQ